MKPMNDMIELSDHFRRSAQFKNHNAVARVVAQAHKFACEVTNIDMTYPRHNEINRRTTGFQAEILTALTTAAKDAGLSRIVLPLHKDSPFAQFVQQEVLNKNDFGMKITFRSSEYKKDMAAIGDIDKTVKTALDKGIRGVCAINSNLKYKWDSDMRPVPS